MSICEISSFYQGCFDLVATIGKLLELVIVPTVRVILQLFIPQFKIFFNSLVVPCIMFHQLGKGLKPEISFSLFGLEGGDQFSTDAFVVLHVARAFEETAVLVDFGTEI